MAQTQLRPLTLFRSKYKYRWRAGKMVLRGNSWNAPPHLCVWYARFIVELKTARFPVRCFIWIHKKSTLYCALFFQVLCFGMKATNSILAIYLGQLECNMHRRICLPACGMTWHRNVCAAHFTYYAVLHAWQILSEKLRWIPLLSPPIKTGTTTHVVK